MWGGWWEAVGGDWRHFYKRVRIAVADLWAVLDETFPAAEVPDAFAREAMRHEAYAAPRRGLYLGGEAYLKALDTALALGKQRILIEGQSGGGMVRIRCTAKGRILGVSIDDSLMVPDDKQILEEGFRPIIMWNASGSCWHPYVKGFAPMVNSLYNGSRFEDVWFDK